MTPDERFPIVTRALLPASAEDDINGPCCIEVPAFVTEPLGRYYLYFSHHHGDRIQLAYADTPTGPWTLHPPGALALDAVEACVDHIASPDVVADPDTGELLMYFHGLARDGGGEQPTYLARSRNGLDFIAEPAPLTDFYLRVVRWRDVWVGMSKGGVMYVSRDGRRDFRRLRVPALPMRDRWGNAPGDARHVALHLEGDRLWVAFTRIGDAPEHIRLGFVDLSRPPAQWRIHDHVSLLEPVHPFEGANLPVAPSHSGAAKGAENALRDPHILVGDDGLWLFYAFAGEQGIALTRLPDLGEWHASQPREAAAPASAPPSRGKSLGPTIAAMREPGALAERLALLDRDQPVTRIFIMGCGRSGTWLLTTLMSGIADLTTVAKELPVEAFGGLRSRKPALALKRQYDSYLSVESIPDSIFILHIVRHPFDVLTSRNPAASGDGYHIAPERWSGEIAALRWLVESARPRVAIVTYEDLVTDPATAMRRIAASVGLEFKGEPTRLVTESALPEDAATAMHGQRPIDRNSIGRYRRDPSALDYLRAIEPSLRVDLEWVRDRFGYDLDLS